ncbi:MAG: restriction endonuclease subunit S [Candidatus Omnitrophica bacterium]|nr:restriction endonuclease subunit S [Candidatus Omnitrophota bacterium]
MKPNWPTKKLGEVAKVESGGTPKRSESKYFGGIIPFVKINDMLCDPLIKTEETITKEGLQNSAAKLWRKGTLLFSIFATLGRVSELAIDAAANQAIAGIFDIDSKLVNKNYLKYYLYKIGPILALRGRGVAQNNINLSILKNIEIPLPTLPIQHRIVERLDAIRKAQELNDKQIALTDELFQSVLHQELKPKRGWGVRRLGEVCEKIQQVHPKKIFKKEFRYIDIESVNPKANTIIEIKRIEVDKAPSRARKFVKEGDVLFATTRPYLKNIAYIENELDNSICSTGFCVIRSKRNLAESKFLFFLSLFKPFLSKVLIYQRGTSYPAVSDSNIYNLKIPLPPLVTQRQIVKKLQAVQDYKKKLLEQKQKLKELFLSCLDKAMKEELVNG